MKIFKIMDECYCQAQKQENEYDDLDLNSSYSCFHVMPKTCCCYSEFKVIESIDSKLRGLLQRFNPHKIRNVIQILKAELFYLYKSEGVNIEPRLSILTQINSCVWIDRKITKKYSDNTGLGNYIRNICILACHSIILFSSPDQKESYHSLYSSELLVANTAKRMKEYYPECEIRHGKVKNQSKYIRLMAKTLEQKILNADPEYILSKSYSLYFRSYKNKIGLFSSPKNGEYVRKYLLNLSAKLLSLPKPLVISHGAKSLEEIFDLADIIVSAYNPFVHSQFEFINLDDPIESLTKMMLNGAIVSDFQYHPEAISELIRGCFLPFYTAIEKETKLSVDVILSIHQVIVKQFYGCIEGKKQKPKLKISKSDFIEIISKQLPDLPIWKIISFYNRFVYHKPVNEAYIEPWNVENIDLDARYLFGSPYNKSVYFPLIPLNSFGLFEEMSRIVNYDSKIGIEFEKFIRKWLADNLKAQVYSGKYILDDKVYESDGILIVEDYIIILECKRKPLTRKARSAHIGKVLKDVSQSFIDSAIQAYRCEVAIRERNIISLYASESSDKDILNGSIQPDQIINIPEMSQFIRFSITPHNFGILNETIVCHNIFETYTKYKFISTDPKINLDDLYEKGKSLINLWKRMSNHYKSKDGDLFKKVTINTILMSYNILYLLTSKDISKTPPLTRIINYLHIQSNSYNSLDIISDII